jgi:NAD(P)H-hydrate repair Nnr-like enzyme with NAD(P)H-hydrate dehydratase domain
MADNLLTSYVTNLIPRLRRDINAHKGVAGKVLIIGGDAGMAGALILAGKSALYLGAGWVVLEMLDQASAKVSPSQPELMISYASEHSLKKITSQGASAIAIGPGLGNSTLQ